MAQAKSDFFVFVEQVVAAELGEVSRRLKVSPALATAVADVGASRQEPADYFFAEIAHYFYAGDTALHMAAAAFRPSIAKLLVKHGANCRAKNRRGAEPLHYAADTNHWQPAAQAETIEYLLSVGADPNALDKSGVSPLHRAVRTRSLPAVRALLDGGADARLANKAGSTPLHLAVQSTGRAGGGTDLAREQQAGIITLLLERGAKLTDKDGRGKQVRQAATSEWTRSLLSSAASE
ncbi:ankyrin repeat domain-containing protein [Anatilimnocola floriformis]|uniref:ankyrin repeat domain-containing protein n=1 Tax=Anatilimnocola floriformis TaxID=2948575 RepID=UPI0020C40E90|nr:ankyrin repeat domain-containing protein [Anatilimnocola floriformis]